MLVLLMLLLKRGNIALVHSRATVVAVKLVGRDELSTAQKAGVLVP